jgi:hypothetical protein
MKVLIFIAQYAYAKIILPCHEAGVFFTGNKNLSGEREYTGKEGNCWILFIFMLQLSSWITACGTIM